MHAAPESALLRESVPQSRAVTAIVPPEEKEKKHEIAGIPILWLIIGGAVAFVGIVAALATAAVALLTHKDAAPTATTTATTAAPTVAYPTATPSDSDEDREEHHPPPPGKPHGHGKHKP